MKNIVFILLYYSVITLTYSQDFLISNLNQNDLWVEMQNPIFVMVQNMPCDSFFLSTNNGVIKNSEGGFNNYKCEKGAYYIKPLTTGSATIIINSISSGDTIVLGQKEFRVRNFPDIIGTLNGQNPCKIRSKELAVRVGISAEFDYSNFPFDLDIKFAVLKYSVFIIHENKAYFYKEYEGYKFSKELKDKFSELIPNDKVLFFDIEAIGIDGTTKKVRNFEAIII